MRSLVVTVVVALAISGCHAANSKKADVVETAKSLQSSDEPVKFEALQGFLPSTDAIATAGWEKREMSGMALSVPIKGSQASITLKKGDAEVVVDIIDTVFNPSLYAPVAAYLSNGFSAKDANGYKKAVTVAGQPAFEEWNKTDRTAGLTVIVGKRFLMHVLGTGVDSTEPATFMAGQIDMARLAALK